MKFSPASALAVSFCGVCLVSLTVFVLSSFPDTQTEAQVYLGKVFTKPLVKRNDFEYRIYSNNVRYDAPAERRYPDERPWSERVGGVVLAIELQMYSYPMLIGIQEALHNQLVDIKTGINQNGFADYPYTHFGVGRDDGQEKGEYAAIIYNVEEWTLINGTYKWLSETPDQPGKSWGAGNNRIVTICTFQSKLSGQFINYLNTHLDERSEEARVNSANLIVNWIAQIPNDYPTFLSGDFNSVSTGAAYQIVVGTLADTDTDAYNYYNTNLPTYTGFEPTDKQNTIDFIFAPKDSDSATAKDLVIGHDVLDNVYNGYKFSDHRPISTHFKLKNI